MPRSTGSCRRTSPTHVPTASTVGKQPGSTGKGDTAWGTPGEQLIAEVSGCIGAIQRSRAVPFPSSRRQKEEERAEPAKATALWPSLEPCEPACSQPEAGKGSVLYCKEPREERWGQQITLVTTHRSPSQPTDTTRAQDTSRFGGSASPFQHHPGRSPPPHDKHNRQAQQLSHSEIFMNCKSLHAPRRSKEHAELVGRLRPQHPASLPAQPLAHRGQPVTGMPCLSFPTHGRDHTMPFLCKGTARKPLVFKTSTAPSSWSSL